MFMIWKLLACIFMVITAAFVVTVVMDIIKKNKTRLDFEDSLHKTGLPVISLKFLTLSGGIETYNLIVDTGSTVNVLDCSYLENLQYDETGDNTELFGVGGSTGEASKCRLNFYDEDNLYSGDFIIKDLSSSLDYIEEVTGYIIHGLVGTSFLDEFKYKIDFQKHRLHK